MLGIEGRQAPGQGQADGGNAGQQNHAAEDQSHGHPGRMGELNRQPDIDEKECLQ